MYSLSDVVCNFKMAALTVDKQNREVLQFEPSRDAAGY